jgi:repressor LexA
MKGLTPKQHQILQYIEQFIAQHHYSPSYRELMKHFNFRSPGTIFKHIQTLKRKGVLNGDPQVSRSILPVKQTILASKINEVQLPFIGNLSIGYPLELFIQPKIIEIASSLVRDVENTYLLRVQGELLADEGIYDSDLLLIEARQDVQAGEIILGLINQHDTVLKRYYPEGLYIRLESQHPNHPPLTLRHEHIAIQGILVGLMRIY